MILFNFSANTSQPFTASTVASVNTRARDFYYENTYGQTLLSFTVAGWYTISSASTTSCDYTSWASQAEAAASAAGVNLSALDRRRIFAFPKVSACAWTGMGNLSGPRSWSNGSYSLRGLSRTSKVTISGTITPKRRSASTGRALSSNTAMIVTSLVHPAP